MNRIGIHGVCGVALLFLLGLAPAMPGQPYRLRVMIPTRQMIRENRIEDAIAFLQAAADRAEDPDDQACYMKEASNLAQSRLRDAERAMRLAEKIADPARSQSQQLVVLAGAQRWPDITNRFADVDIGAWPETWRLDAYLARSEAWLKSGNTDRAEQDLRNAIDAFGPVATRGRACQRLGHLYQYTRHDPARALAAYRKGLSLTEAAYAWRNECFLGMIGILVEQGRYDEAAAAFQTIDYKRMSSDYWRAAFYLPHAAVLRHQGYNGQAATLLTRALRLPELSEGTRQRIESELDQLIADLWERQEEGAAARP